MATTQDAINRVYTTVSQAVGMSNLGNTSGTTGMASGNQVRAVIVGGNNITVSQSVNGSSATLTLSAANQTIQPGIQSISGGTTRATTGEVVFSNSNGVSFGVNGNTVTASHNGLTSQSNQAISGSNGSFTFQTATFGNLNGMSFYTSNGSVVGSYTVPTVTNSSMTISDSATSGTLARLAFTNQNGITLSLSTGAGGSHTIVGSHNALTSQSNQAVSAANGSYAFQTLSLSNANGISFGTSAGSAITASHNALTSQSNQAFSAAGGSSAFQTLGFSDNGYASFTNTNGSVAINALRGSYFATGNTTQSSSGTINADTVILRGSGAVSVGVSNGSIIFDAPSAAAGNVTFSAGANSAGLASLVFSNSNGVSFGLNGSTITASAAGGGGGLVAGMSNIGNTAGTSGTVGSQLVFVGSNGIDLSQSVDGGSATLTIYPKSTNEYIWPPSNASSMSVFSQGSYSIQYVPVPMNLSGTAIDIHASVSLSTNGGTNSVSMSHWCGIYTRSGSTLNSVATASNLVTFTYASNSTSSHAGLVQIKCPIDFSLTPGVYYVGNALSTTHGGVGITGISMYGNISGIGTAANAFHYFGSVSATSSSPWLGMGLYSATVNSAMTQVLLSGIRHTGSNNLRANLLLAFRG